MYDYPKGEHKVNHIGILAPSLGVAVGIPVPVAIVGGVVVTGLATYGAYRLYRDFRRKKDPQEKSSATLATSEVSAASA